MLLFMYKISATPLFFLLQSVLKQKFELPLVYRHSVWSAQELGPFIRLCLMDQNFPAFVEDVEKELKKLAEGWAIFNSLPLEYLLQDTQYSGYTSLNAIKYLKVSCVFVSVLFLKTGESTFYTSLHFNKYTEHKFMHLQLRTSWEPC